MNTKALLMAAILIALAALLVSTVALFQAKSAKQLAMSDIAITDGASLMTPIFNEEAGQYSYLAIYEFQISNLCGPALQLTQMGKADAGTGFLMPVKDQQIQLGAMTGKLFVCSQPIPDIQADPGLLPQMMKQEITEMQAANLPIEMGASKTIRLGVSFNPYDAEKKSLADVVLLSFRFAFADGREYTIRRGVTIQPIVERP